MWYTLLMEREGLGEDMGDPPVDNAFDQLGDRIGDRPCPMCGRDQWTVLTEQVGLHASFAPVIGATRAGSINVGMLFCNHCKFLRMHVLEGEEG